MKKDRPLPPKSSYSIILPPEPWREGLKEMPECPRYSEAVKVLITYSNGGRSARHSGVFCSNGLRWKTE